jgi:hypothetical protein
MTTEHERTQRNVNPHKPARIAMVLWGGRYVNQGGGSMDFWDRLSPARQQLCRDILEQIEQAPAEDPAAARRQK